MGKMKTICLLGMFVCSNLSFAVADTAVNLGDFLEDLSANNPFFVSENLRYDIEASRRDSTLGGGDFNFKTSADYQYNEAVGIDAFSAPIQKKSTGTVGIGKEVWATGGNFSAEAQTIYSDSKTSPYLEYYNIDSRYAYNQIAVSYTQPLLKNRGGFLSRYYYDNQDFAVKISKLLSEENIENFQKQQAFEFMQWILLKKQYEIYSNRLALSESELKRTEDKFNSNLVDKVDVIRARDSVSISKQNLKLVELKEKSKKAQLSIISKSDKLLKSDPVENILVEGFLSEQMHSVNKERLKSTSRILQILDLQIEQLKHSKKKYEQERKGDLSLYTKYTVKDSDKKFESAQNFNNQDAQVGVYYRIPWQNREAKARIKEYELQIQQAKSNYEEKHLNLLADLDSLYIQIKNIEDVLTLNKEQIVSAKEKTEEELKLYNQGRTQYTFVIASQDNQQNAELNYISNLITYKNLLIAYLEVMDVLGVTIVKK